MPSHEIQEIERELATVNMHLRRLRSVTSEPHFVAHERRPDVRTCAHCGEQVVFRVDPMGSWAECTACGRLA